MNEIRVTLVGDGSSDKALINIIKWVLNDSFSGLAIKCVYADFRNLPKPPLKSQILEQIKYADKYYPFDILIYHRDAERTDNNVVQKRKEEVLNSLSSDYSNRVVCIVPIVMMETWLLIDEMSIKKAAGNRNYKDSINLPSVSSLETIKDPKERLHTLLKEVSGLKKRSLKAFNVHEAVHLVSENINDFSLLRKLSSFQAFEKDVKDKLIELGY